MAKIRVTRRAHTRKDGTKVKEATFLIKDRGKKGRTPEGKRWYRPSVHTGWEKGMPIAERRRLVLKAHKGDLLDAGRSLQALANVTIDKATKRAAEADSTYFFKKYAKRTGIKSTAKTKKG